MTYLGSIVTEDQHADVQASAVAASLGYVTDQAKGITRRASGKSFSYRVADGSLIRDAAILARIKTLAIPPAWKNVWICPHPNGHIQATGRDARGRKQYRYHARWQKQRNETKFEHMLKFGMALPDIRNQLEHDLSLPGLPRSKVLAAVVRLMEHTLARVGNVEYARDNGHFGLTTLRNRHVRIKGGQIELDFSAKHGIRHNSVVKDAKLARILKRCRDLPGSELFQYLDDNGNRHAVDSSDLNAYLREISGQDISGKDFRTWAGTNLALLAIFSIGEQEPTKRNCLEVIRHVATQLGNTPAVCRSFYIHPKVLEHYLEGTLAKLIQSNKHQHAHPALLPIERMTLQFLQSLA